MDIATLKREYLAQRGIISKDEEIDVVGDDGSEGSFASHRKKLSAFTIESILSGMADMKDDDSLSDANLNSSFDEGDRDRDFQRSPSPTTSTTSSPPTSPHMQAVMAHHLRNYQAAHHPAMEELALPTIPAFPHIKPEPLEQHAEENPQEEDDNPHSLTKSHLPIQRPIPLFSSHHLPLYIREKLRAAASSASPLLPYPTLPHPALPLRPLSPGALGMKTHVEEKVDQEAALVTSINNNTVDTLGTP